MIQFPWRTFIFLLHSFRQPSSSAPPPTPKSQGPPGKNSFCAMYNDSSAMDCSFVTSSECQAAISGVGGACQANNFPQGQYAPRLLPQLIPPIRLGFIVINRRV